MSHRLEVALDNEEFRALQAAARRHRSTVSDYVRTVLREALADEPERGAVARLVAVREAASHAFPTADIEQMEAQIRAGRDLDRARMLVGDGLESGPSEPFPEDYFEKLRDRLPEG